MATAKKITIHDVALAAGVSVSTVSLVLSGKGRISTATGERVNAAIQHPPQDERANAAIEERGFVRNRQASALRGGQSGVIGLIVRDLSALSCAVLRRIDGRIDGSSGSAGTDGFFASRR